MLEMYDAAAVCVCVCVTPYKLAYFENLYSPKPVENKQQWHITNTKKSTKDKLNLNRT